MNIQVAPGKGIGPTPLAAFDAALMDASVADLNLIYLSSVIPPGARVVQEKPRFGPECYGQRLYLVMAKQHAEELGQEAWAGLGWTQNSDTGHGLFVELHGHSQLEVDRGIDATLGHMTSTRSIKYGPIQRELCGVQCAGQPVCVIVVATYEIAPWRI